MVPSQTPTGQGARSESNLEARREKVKDITLVARSQDT
jgi:hypothetical protein